MMWQKDGFRISSNRDQVNIEILHDLLSRSYWAKDRTREDIEKSIQTSLCFSLLNDDHQIGFARVLTDSMAYAIILDMIISDDFRGQGLGKWLMECIGDHPAIKPLRQLLWTGDADGFYRKSGFEEMPGLKFMARNWVMKL